MNSMHPSISKPRRRSEAGYSLLLVIFLVASMILMASAVVPNVLTEGRRQKEEDMIWRGQQYARAIGLYYRKFGKYPTKIEDLTRPTNGVRFLRKAYTDPMNKDDGSWRFIYVGPNGQLIGSVHQTSLLQTTLSMPGIGGLSALGGGLQTPAAPGAAAGTTQQPGAGPAVTQMNSGLAPNPLESQPQGLLGSVIGGNIIGVGSKVDKPSLKVYLGGATYKEWEFIWNPTGQVAAPGQAPVNPNANPTSLPNGANPNAPNPNPPDGQQPPQTPPQPGVNVPPPPPPGQQ
jgi:type II secretory pathway pseudopilin PulG